MGAKLFIGAVKTYTVIKPFKDIALIVPEYMAQLTSCLRTELKKPADENPTNPLTGEDLDQHVDEMLTGTDGLIDVMVDKVQEQVTAAFIEPAITNMIDRGADIARKSMDGSSNAINDVNDNAQNAGRPQRDPGSGD